MKDEPEDDMLSLVAVEGDQTDRAVGTCHDTVTTAKKGVCGLCRRRHEYPSYQPQDDLSRLMPCYFLALGFSVTGKCWACVRE